MEDVKRDSEKLSACLRSNADYLTVLNAMLHQAMRTERSQVVKGLEAAIQQIKDEHVGGRTYINDVTPAEPRDTTASLTSHPSGQGRY